MGQLSEDVPKKSYNNGVLKKRNTSVIKRSGLRARNLSEEEELASSQESEDEDEKIEDDFDDDEDNEADEKHEDEVDDEEGDNITKNVIQDQEEDEDEEDDDYDDEGENEIGKQISKDEHNFGYANVENDLQIVVASNGNDEEVTKPDITEDIDKQNEPIEGLDMDEDAQVEEERFKGTQFEKVLVQENTNEKKDYDDGDGYLIRFVDYTNSIVSGVVGELDVDEQLDIERIDSNDVTGAPREELTQQTTSKAIHESNKDEEGDNACMSGYEA
ncbi:hypothetical protein V2J09_001319 [Rumex salicifolius]